MPDAHLSIERRVHPRISIKVPVKYRSEEDRNVLKTIEKWRSSEKNAYTLDLSVGGMNLVLDQTLRIGEILKFDLYLLDGVVMVTVYAEVKWSNPKGTGLRFLMMPEDEQSALKAFLEKSALH